MQTNNYNRGFATLTFVIFISAVLVFFVVDDTFEENTLQTQLNAVESHYNNYYFEQSCKELKALMRIQNPTNTAPIRIGNRICSS